MRALLLAFLTCGLLTSVDDSAPKGDLAELQGTWKGKAGPPDEEVQLTMVVEGDAVTETITMDNGEEHTNKAKLKLDDKASPKAMDLVDFERQPGSKSPPPSPRIYELKGDTLKVCCGHNDSSPRPTEFKTGGEGRDYTIVITLKRPKE